MLYNLSVINKFKKLPVVAKLVFTVLLFIILWKLVDFYSYKESREHDRLPVILTNSVEASVVDESLYTNSEYNEGDNCSPVERVAIQNSIGGFEEDQFYTCKKFITNNGTFFLFEKTSYALVILEKSSDIFELVIKETGEYGNFKNYPGINSFRMRGNQDDVVIVYEGWNNPRKIIKLTTK